MPVVLRWGNVFISIRRARWKGATAEGARVQRTQLEIGRFVSQTVELSSEIEVGGHGNFQAPV
jgi:hypothetical protein